jgi:enoyl-CoA hydratase
VTEADVNDVTEGPLLLRREGTTAVLTLNRPEARNALDGGVLGLLSRACASLAADASVLALVVTGAGAQAFCAGADIRHMRLMSANDGRRWAHAGHDTFQQIEDLPKPVIAAINGVVLGGGCELALACDFRIMADSASIGQPEIKLGLIPGWGGTQRLPRLVGLTLAKELVLTGRLLTAAEALHAGLVNQLAPAAEVLPRALAFAAQFAALPPIAVAAAKRAMHLGRDLPLGEANGVEVEAFAQVFGSSDRDEGIAAFLEKRPPEFRGR